MRYLAVALAIVLSPAPSLIPTTCTPLIQVCVSVPDTPLLPLPEPSIPAPAAPSEGVSGVQGEPAPAPEPAPSEVPAPERTQVILLPPSEAPQEPQQTPTATATPSAAPKPSATLTARPDVEPEPGLFTVEGIQENPFRFYGTLAGILVGALFAAFALVWFQLGRKRERTEQDEEFRRAFENVVTGSVLTHEPPSEGLPPKHQAG